MKKTSILVVVALAFALPVSAFAASYHYINLEGEVVTIEATNATEALAIARANNDILHSGVKIDEGILEEGQLHAIVYQYVDTNNNLKTITAASLDAARILATDKAPTSGFLRVGTTQ